MKTRYQLFSSTKIVLPHLTRQMWISNTLISTFSLPFGSAESSVAVCKYVHSSQQTCLFYFRNSYLAVILLALHISSHFIIVHLYLTLCVCVLSRLLSALILKTPDIVSVSQPCWRSFSPVRWRVSSFLEGNPSPSVFCLCYSSLQFPKQQKKSLTPT